MILFGLEQFYTEVKKNIVPLKHLTMRYLKILDLGSSYSSCCMDTLCLKWSSSDKKIQTINLIGITNVQKNLIIGVLIN